MKYLVTFALVRTVDVATDFSLYYDNTCETSTTMINETVLHSIIFKVDGNNKLSEKIKEVRDIFFKNNERKFYIKSFECIGITPIVDNEIEQAIKFGFGNYQFPDKTEIDNNFNEIVHQLFLIVKEHPLYRGTIKISKTHKDQMINWIILYMELNHSYDELKDYLESKISNIDKAFQGKYCDMISDILQLVYSSFYGCLKLPSYDDLSPNSY